MSRIDNLGEILDGYEGRKLIEPLGYKQNFCMILDAPSFKLETSSSIQNMLVGKVLDFPREMSYAYIRTNPAGALYYPWIEDLDSFISQARQEQLEKRHTNCIASALDSLAEDRTFSGMLVIDRIIRPGSELHKYLEQLSRKGCKFCVICQTMPDLWRWSHMFDESDFAHIVTFADTYHTSNLKELEELMDKYIKYAIHGEKKPTKYKLEEK